MNCKQATDTMLMALYGESAENDARDLALHVAACRRCAKKLDRLSVAAGTIARAEGHPMRAAIPVPAVIAPLSRRAPRLIYAAAAVVIFIAGALALRSRLPGAGTAHSEAPVTTASSRGATDSIVPASSPSSSVAPEPGLASSHTAPSPTGSDRASSHTVPSPAGPAPSPSHTAPAPIGSARASSRTAPSPIASATVSTRSDSYPTGSATASARKDSYSIGSVAATARRVSAPISTIPATASLADSKKPSPYASEASVEAEISALDSALSKLESSPTEL